MTYTRREALNFWLGLLVSSLAFLALLAPQLADARSDTKRARADFAGLVEAFETECAVARDGSAVCPAGTIKTFEVPAGHAR